MTDETPREPAQGPRLPAAVVRSVIADEQTWLLGQTVETLKSRCSALAVQLTAVTRERDQLAARLAALEPDPSGEPDEKTTTGA